MDAPRCVATNTLPWFGAIFAAVYAALYTRFSSQWTYLAGLYNQIKAAEVQVAVSANTDSTKDVAAKVLTSWKAGFIEDAEELHLALKPMFAEVIRTWSEDEKVQSEFAKYAPGGEEGLKELLSDIERVLPKRVRDDKQKALEVSKGSPSLPPQQAA